MIDMNSPTRVSSNIIRLIALLISLITFLIYAPALENDFVNWDDNEYVYENPYISSLNPQSLYWMLSSFHSDNWHPLTWFSHAVDLFFWNLNPRGHHLTNIILHGLNTFFVFFLVIQLMMRAKEVNGMQKSSKMQLSISTQTVIVASITAMLFGLHPLHVESVVWVAERKDLLCAFFVLLSFLSYLSYTSSIGKRYQRTWFTTCLLLFILALMSKPMAVTLPIVLLLWDIYPLKRIGLYTDKNMTVLIEKIPFFVLSIASSIITILAQRSGGALGTLDVYYLDDRLFNALRSLVFYLEKMIVPVKLLPFYPFPAHIHWLDIKYLASGFLVIAITGISLWMAKKGKYLLLTSWLYYLVTLLPVLGIIQVGKQAAADRYTYLPSLSPFILVGIGIVWIWEKIIIIRHSKILRILAAMSICSVMSLLGYLTVQQIRIWHDSEVMWKHVIDTSPRIVPTAYNNLGTFYIEKGMLEDAINQFKQAIEMSPTYAKAYNNLAWIYATSQNSIFRNGDKAIALAIKACELTKFENASLLDTLAAAYAEAGYFDKAIEYQNRAINLSQKETKVALLKRLELYQSGKPYRSQ